MKTLILAALLIPSVSLANDLKLVGEGLLEYSILKIDIYEIKYFQSADGLEELRLKYKTDVKKKYSIMGWEKGLAHLEASFKPKIQWILDNTQDFQKGDQLLIRRNKGEVSLLKNGAIFAQINDPQIAEIIFEPWIGSSPVDEDLKKQLLKNYKELK